MREPRQKTWKHAGVTLLSVFAIGLLAAVLVVTLGGVARTGLIVGKTTETLQWTVISMAIGVPMILLIVAILVGLLVLWFKEEGLLR